MEIKDFTNLSLKENMEILKIRNSFKVRRWMYNSKKISYKDHKNFIKALKKSNQKYFLLKEKNRIIGSFNLKGEFIGLYQNPLSKGKGEMILKKALDFAKQKGLKKVYLETLYNNKRAIKLYKKTGFKEVKKLYKNARVILFQKTL